VDGKDADTNLLDEIRKLRPDVVLGSECIYDLGGSHHRASTLGAVGVVVGGLGGLAVVGPEALVLCATSGLAAAITSASTRRAETRA
jgi:hypothetical protein